MSTLHRILTRLEEKATKVPERFRIGIKNQTIPNPGFSSDASYSGAPNAFDFGAQEINYKAISRALKALGKKLIYVGATTKIGQPAYNASPKSKPLLTSFVAVDHLTNPTFVWQKYEGFTAGGGKNVVYYNGQMQKLSEFLGLGLLIETYPKIGALLKKGRDCSVFVRPSLYIYMLYGEEGDILDPKKLGVTKNVLMYDAKSPRKLKFALER